MPRVNRSISVHNPGRSRSASSRPPPMESRVSARILWCYLDHLAEEESSASTLRSSRRHSQSAVNPRTPRARQSPLRCREARCARTASGRSRSRCSRPRRGRGVSLAHCLLELRAERFHKTLHARDLFTSVTVALAQRVLLRHACDVRREGVSDRAVRLLPPETTKE